MNETHMANFLGKHIHSLDSKGRVSIPSKFRRATGEVFIVTRGLDGCLFLYPRDEWEGVIAKFRSLEWTDDDPRFFSREFTAFASEVIVDSHGRIVIPQELREIAGLEGEALFIGAIDRIEIWHPTSYHEYRKGYKHTLEEASRRLYKGPQPPGPDEGEKG